jgi:ABC-type lipoprotein export system ATPase subunit
MPHSQTMLSVFEIFRKLNENKVQCIEILTHDSQKSFMMNNIITFIELANLPEKEDR